MVRGDPFYLKLWVNRPRWSKIADFQPIFDGSSSAVTPSEQISINTNRKSTMRFPMSQVRTLFLSPSKGGSKKQSVPNLNNKLR